MAIRECIRWPGPLKNIENKSLINLYKPESYDRSTEDASLMTSDDC